MSSTTKTTKTTTAAPKTRQVILNAHAARSLGFDPVAVNSETIAARYREGQDAVASAAWGVYVLLQGLTGVKFSTREVANLLGIKSTGSVSALQRTGAILNRAGASAHDIARQTLTLCQNTNAEQTAPLDTLSGKALALAVRKMSADALAAKRETRKARPAGTSTDKGTSKATDKGADVTTLVAAVATNAGRMTVAVAALNRVTRTATDNRDEILGMVSKASALLAEIEAAYSVTDAEFGAQTAEPVATPAPKRTRKARATA